MDTTKFPILDRGTRFLLAKFVPDLRRMEPRNIGLIGWSRGRVVARFVGENGHGPGKIGVLPPRLGNSDKVAYQQWIQTWRYYIARGAIRALSGETVFIDSPNFLDALQEQSKKSFRLVDSVTILDEVSYPELDGMLDDLFYELVETHSDRLFEKQLTSGAKQLKRRTNALFKHTGLWDRPDFHKDGRLAATEQDEYESFVFDYYIGDDIPAAVYQRVAIDNQPSVTNAAYTLEWINSNARFRGKTHCASLVDSRASKKQSRVQFALRELEKHSLVIDISSSDAGMKIMSLIA